jgi:hypothetical protein
MRCRAVSGSWEKIRRTVIPVQTGIQIRYLMAKTALDAGSHPTRLVRNDDELIALTIIKQPPDGVERTQSRLPYQEMRYGLSTRPSAMCWLETSNILYLPQTHG